MAIMCFQLAKALSLLFIVGVGPSRTQHHVAASFATTTRCRSKNDLLSRCCRPPSSCKPDRRPMLPMTPMTALQRPSWSLSMALIPLQKDDTQLLLSTGLPSPLQYEVYWGRTPTERYGRLLQSCIVSFLGVNFSYFLSFVLGGFVATILGTLFVFWGILSPYLNAFQRNWEFLGGRPLVDADAPPKSGLFSALYLGHLADVCVVEDAKADTEYDLMEFADYTMETDDQERWTGEPYLLRIVAKDRTDRELMLHARLSEEYLSLQVGMPLCCLLLSTRSAFDSLNGISDFYIPDAGCWIGDYPHLDRAELEDLLAQDDEVWEAFENEGINGFSPSAAEERNRGAENTGTEPSAEWQARSTDDKIPARRRRQSY